MHSFPRTLRANTTADGLRRAIVDATVADQLASFAPKPGDGYPDLLPVAPAELLLIIVELHSAVRESSFERHNFCGFDQVIIKSRRVRRAAILLPSIAGECHEH